VGGAWGAIATGLFASVEFGSAAGAFAGNWGQLWTQIVAVTAVGAYSFIGTWVILKTLNLFMFLRVSNDEESQGLDISLHQETGYNF
jgi:Amt family ammonium transporter